jgi:hypothetical protein
MRFFGHPLEAALGAGWRYPTDHTKLTVFILHRGGFYVETSASSFADLVTHPEQAQTLAAALLAAVEDGKTGQYSMRFYEGVRASSGNTIISPSVHLHPLPEPS